jgi:transposase
METDPTRMIELLVGLPDVNIEGIDDWPQCLRVTIITRAGRPVCPGWAGGSLRHDVLDVELVDLACFGRRTRQVWSKQRWRCRNPNCEVVTFIELDDRIAAKRAGITDRAGRWATFQVGHYGRALIDEPNRIGQVTAVGLDEILFCRDGPFEHLLWSTQVVDVARGQLLDVVPGRNAAGACVWFAFQPAGWFAAICWATLDLSGPYRRVFDTLPPEAVQIADPFHVVKLANFTLDEVRRRVQNKTLDHRGRKTDPLYRIRKLMTMAHERLDQDTNTKLLGRLEAGDPKGEGHTITKWRNQIAAWHQARHTNGPTEAVNNLIKRVKQVAFGISNWVNYRTRAILYAGQPNWTLLGLNPR